MPLNNRMHSLKATLYSAYLDFRSMCIIIIEIMFGLIIFQLGIISIVSTGNSSSNASALNTGFMIALWSIPISIIVITSNAMLIKKFSFPVDRSILALSHLVYILLSPLVILLASCGLYLLEYLFYSAIQTIYPSFIYLWITTKGSFITGFLFSYLIIVLISSATYCLFMYFYRYKMATSVVCGMIVVLLFTLSPFRMFVLSLGKSLLINENPWILFATYTALSLLLWLLGYIPLKRMEVKK